MENNIQPVDEINVTSDVARWLMQTCLTLIKHYLGRDFEPHYGTMSDRVVDFPTIEDKIGHGDPEVSYWANNLMTFLTTIAGILGNAIAVGDLMRMREILPIDYDENNINEDPEGKYEI